jgi:hypothetical protein
MKKRGSSDFQSFLLFRFFEIIGTNEHPGVAKR